MASSEPLSTDDFARWWKETGERELRQLLYWVWDPIGVSGSFPWAADEYDGYASQVVQALRKGKDEADIATMLQTIEQERPAELRCRGVSDDSLAARCEARHAMVRDARGAVDAGLSDPAADCSCGCSTRDRSTPRRRSR
jgi:hypothetical protein